MGPTASGKSGLALKLAEKYPVEIISVDSALVYRGMDIGTAKPDAATRAKIPHHLVDIRDPTERYSAAQFRADALKLMAGITARRRVPLLTGGTMLYFKALRQGLSQLPEADPELRREIDERARQHGWPALHARLEKLDPTTAARLKPTDAQRIQRALEVCYLTGQPMSYFLCAPRDQPLPYDGFAIAFIPSDRAILHQRIADRFSAMLSSGLVEEVRELKRRYPLHPGLPSMRSVGYRQVWGYVEGQYDLADLHDRGVAATRQLAKRQLTWLRSMSEVNVVDCLAHDVMPRIERLLKPRIPSA